MSGFKVGDEVLVRAVVTASADWSGLVHVRTAGLPAPDGVTFESPDDIRPISRLTDLEAENARLKAELAKAKGEPAGRVIEATEKGCLASAASAGAFDKPETITIPPGRYGGQFAVEGQRIQIVRNGVRMTVTQAELRDFLAEECKPTTAPRPRLADLEVAKAKGEPAGRVIEATEKGIMASAAAAAVSALDVVFDGPPGPEGGRFVEVEGADGQSVVGEWVHRPDGYWALRLRVVTECKPSAPKPRIRLADLEELAAEVERTVQAAHAAAKAPVDRRSASAYLEAVEKADAAVRALDLALGATGDEPEPEGLGEAPSGRFIFTVKDGWFVCGHSGLSRSFESAMRHAREEWRRLAFLDRVNFGGGE